MAIFDFSQNAAERWRGSNNAVRREILDLVCLNRALGDLNLDATKRKPFDVFAEGLEIKNSRDNGTPLELFGQQAETIDTTLSFAAQRLMESSTQGNGSV